MVKILFLLISVSAFGQTAITQLTSFWEMDVTTTDKIAWDSKGSAHATYFGNALNADTSIFGGGWHRTAGTQTPHNSGGMSAPGETVAKGSNSFAYCVWVRRSATYQDIILGQWSNNPATRSWFLNFNATPGRPVLSYAMTDGSTGGITLATPEIDTGELAMICMHYNSSTGAVGLSGNGQAWTLATPDAPFQPVPSGNACSTPAGIYDPWYDCTLDWGHAHAGSFPTGEPVIGRTMYWNGYIPTNAELTDLYNGGSGRDASYFGLSFTPPTRPLTVTLANASFADDANLGATPGLYYLRPFPLKTWKPSLATTNGDYVWVRSTDHQQTSQHLYIGYSSSPETLPSSWTEPNLPHNNSRFGGGGELAPFETPSLVWNPDTSLFHLYAHGDDLLAPSPPFQQVTMMWTSPDLSTWTAGGGDAFPTNVTGCPTIPCRNHTGYAIVIRNGTGDWTAQTLIESSEPSGTDGFIKLGLWSSTDGKNFTFVRETETMVPKMPYRNTQNQRVGSHVAFAGSTAIVSANYVGTPSTQLEFANPAWPLFQHDGDGAYNGVQGNWLQEVRAYEEGGTIWLYAKWSFREPSTVRLYKGTLNANDVTPLNQSDRRPIGAMFIAEHSAVTVTNPRGYNVGGSPDFIGAGFAAAKAALLTSVGNYLDTADLYSPKPQAVCVWDLEGQEFQHTFTYVGQPQMLSVVSPEMDLMADDVLGLITSRGYKPCLTLRPHKVRSGSGRPTNSCLAQGDYDAYVYINTAAAGPNRGYICGTGTATFGGTSTVQVAGTYAVNYQSGSVVRFISSGTLPSPLVSLQDYYLCSWNNSLQTMTVATDSGCSSVISSYSGGSGTHQMMSWRGPSDLSVQELPADLATAYSELSAKIAYAQTRWGVTTFYIDSTYYCANAACQTNTVLPNTGFWDELLVDFPNMTFIPENGSPGAYTIKYLSFNNGSYAPSDAYLAAPHIQETTPGYANWRTAIRAQIADGTPYIVTLNTPPTGSNPNELYRQDLLTNATTLSTLSMSDNGKPRVFKSTPGTSYTFPLTQRVYFAATPNGLAVSLTYCEQKATASCYLSGVLQGSAALNLSALPYYQIRYYSYDGTLVSQGPYATLQ